MTVELDRLLGEGREAYKLGDLTRAETVLSQAVKSGAERYADAHHMLGVIYHTWGQFSKARAAFEEALRINPNYIPAYLHLGLLLHRSGDEEGARKALKEVLKRDPEHERAAMYLRMLEPGSRTE